MLINKIVYRFLDNKLDFDIDDYVNEVVYQNLYNVEIIIHGAIVRNIVNDIKKFL